MTDHLDTLWQQAETEFPHHFGTLGVIADALEDHGSELVAGLRLLVDREKAPMPRDLGDWVWFVGAVDNAAALGVGIGLSPAEWSKIGMSFRKAYETAAGDVVAQGRAN